MRMDRRGFFGVVAVAVFGRALRFIWPEKYPTCVHASGYYYNKNMFALVQNKFKFREVESQALRVARGQKIEFFRYRQPV